MSVIRHCEKSHLQKHCNYIGLERSVNLASLFGDGDERWPKPAYIYAEGAGGRHNPFKRNYREIETVGPLSEKVGVKVKASYDTMTEDALAREILSMLKQGHLCGKLVVISWKHSRIGPLARKLGCGRMEGCPYDYKGKTFDEVWQLRYVYDYLVDGDNTEYDETYFPTIWQVLGSVQNQNFDPLTFSKKQGVSDCC